LFDLVVPLIGMSIAAGDEFLAEAGFLAAAAFGFCVPDFVGAACVIPFMPGIADIARRAESARAAESRCCFVAGRVGCCARAPIVMSIPASSPIATRVAARPDRAIAALNISRLK
jgi:hypothetical protein